MPNTLDSNEKQNAAASAVSHAQLSAMIDAGRHYLRKQQRSLGVPDAEIIKIAVKSMGLDDLKPFDPEEKIIEYKLASQSPEPQLLVEQTLTRDRVGNITEIAEERVELDTVGWDITPLADKYGPIADFLSHVADIDWVLVSGIHNDKLVVIFRCDGYRKSAGKLASRAFGHLGSAGGHKGAARAEVLLKDLELTEYEINSLTLKRLTMRHMK